MPPEEILTQSSEETTEFGRTLAARLNAPVLVLLKGDLGAGKTTLTKGIVSGLGAAVEEDVTSPTFNLVHVFKTQSTPPVKVFHVDLYRLEGTHDLESIALEDILSEPAIAIIEWSERLGTFETPGAVRVSLSYVDEGSRRITIRLP